MNTSPSSDPLDDFRVRAIKLVGLSQLQGQVLRMKKRLDPLGPNDVYAIAHLEKAAADVRFARLAIGRGRSDRG